MNERESWTSYEFRPAPRGILCQFWREGWDRPIIGTREDLHPEMHVGGLLWRMTGIGRERWESLHTSTRAQLEHMTTWAQMANMGMGFSASIFGGPVHAL